MQIFYLIHLIVTISKLFVIVTCHTAKDFDDSTHYKIDFAIPTDFNPDKPEFQGKLYDFYTHEKEKYQCLVVEPGHNDNEDIPKEDSITPLELLIKSFAGPKCLHRIETYWSYEICIGQHVLQYHEEREGKYVNSEEYYLGRWTEDDTKRTIQKLKDNHKAGVKYNSIKIDNINYPYFEMVMTGGTVCDITKTPRVTVIRFVCYTHSKGVIYSIKETSSCNYEVIVLTSTLCGLTFFHPKEMGKIDIKCFNSLTEPNKPLTMFRQELEEIQVKLEELSALKRFSEVTNAKDASTTSGSNNDGTWHTWDNGVDKLIMKFININELDIVTESSDIASSKRRISNIALTRPSQVSDMQPILEFLEGKNCLTGGTGWWKYEFCYGKYVRQFHKDKKTDVALFLGYFNSQKHREWLLKNPEKRHQSDSTVIWYHYEQGTICDRTSQPREVDVKLTCTPLTPHTSPATTSMYLLEPKTCQYILVFESSMVCTLLKYVDENGLMTAEGMTSLRSSIETSNKPEAAVEFSLRGTVEEVSADSITEIPASLSQETTSATELPHSEAEEL